MKSFLSIILTIIIFSLLNGCSTTARNSQALLHDTPQEKQRLSPEDLLTQAEKSNDAILKASLQLKAAQLYYSNGLTSQASAALKDIDHTESPLSTINELLEINLKLGINENLAWHTEKAIMLYEKTKLNRLNIESLKTVLPLLAAAFQQQSQRLKSAILLIEYTGILAPLSAIELNEEIWSHLRSVNLIELNNFSYTKTDDDVIAWLELAKTIQQNQINLESQYTALKKWQLKWPNHPASIEPPKEIALLSKLPDSKASNIILALPFTGPVSPVGKAVRDGFMAAYYYQLPSSKSEPITLTFFDTHTNSIEELYNLALKKQALVIGPLTKSNVNKLQQIDLTLTPTLALNYIDNPLQNTIPHANLFQLGLNPEAEIDQLSKHLSSKGLNKVAYIGPENEHGFRIHDSLLKALKDQQGYIIESVYYNDQKSLSPSVSKLLGTDLSLKRKRTIQNITNLFTEFEPRRRKDIDAIFMLAKPPIAKQLNPLFAYHYAKDLPIYSISQIHQIDDQKDDLDNIHFIEMPWMLNNTIDIKNTIIKAIPSAQTDYSRFYALGADAYSLSPRLQFLKEIQGSQIQGHTGTLSINQKGLVQRSLELAVFKRGKVIIAKED